MTILLIGATGLVGTRLLPGLVDAGLDCPALVRPGRSVPDGVTPVVGDILDTASLDKLAKGHHDWPPPAASTSKARFRPRPVLAMVKRACGAWVLVAVMRLRVATSRRP